MGKTWLYKGRGQYRTGTVSLASKKRKAMPISSPVLPAKAHQVFVCAIHTRQAGKLRHKLSATRWSQGKGQRPLVS